MGLKIGKSMLKNSAGQAREILKKRYPKASAKDLDAAIKEYYGKDKGVEKLNSDGDSGSNKPESPTSK